MIKSSSHPIQPVEIALQGVGQYEVIRTVEEAAEALLQKWPTDSGHFYDSAIANCVRALNNKIEPSYVRAALIAAAEEAKIGVRD